MTSITVKELDGQLVVDSRLIAGELGISHSDWITNTVKKHQSRIEKRFGRIRFQNGSLQTPGGMQKITLV